jgi:hypothetical protein
MGQDCSRNFQLVTFCTFSQRANFGPFAVLIHTDCPSFTEPPGKRQVHSAFASTVAALTSNAMSIGVVLDIGL